MSQSHRFAGRLSIAAVLVLCGCAAPTSGESTSDTQTAPPPSESVGPSESAAPSSSAAPPTTIAPSDPPETTAQAQAGEGEWPPDLIFSDLKEAGATEVVVEGVRVQVPAGFTANPSAAAGTAQLDGTGPGAAGSGSVTVTSTPPAGQDATALLDLHEPAIVRSGAIDVPGAASAAIGERIADGVQTWVLVVVTPAGGAVTAVFTAALADFDALLLTQSLCSTKVVG